MHDLNVSTLTNGSGWEHAYQAQAAAGNQPNLTTFLWQDRPIEFLEDPELLGILRRSNVTRVLDAGAGDARNSLALERQGFFVIGADVAPTAVKLAAERAIRQSQNRAVFLVDDITNLRLAGPFDLVLCADTLGQLDDPTPALVNFRRVLRPGGFLLFNVYSKEDGTYGVGTQLDEWTYEYKGCLFKYFSHEMVLDLVKDWDNVSVKVSTWLDPPHGEFRPVPHVHHSFVVLAQKPEGV